MRRRWQWDGQLTVIPSTTIQRLSLRADPPGGSKTVEIPKDLDPEIIKHIESQGAEKFKASQAGVPEKYEVKFPDKSPLNKAVLERTTATARKLGLTKNEQAQEMLDFVIAEAQGVVDEATNTHKARLQQWEKEVLEAADIGKGKPEIMQAHVARVGRLLDKFFPKDFRAVLDEYGLGSHPGLIRGLSKLADLAKEDTIETGDSSGARKGTAASRLYKKTHEQEKK